MTSTIDGFYAAYLAGRAGNGFAMLILRHGIITGADLVGAYYDGTYTKNPNNNYDVKLNSTLPPNITLIQGGQSSPQGEISKLNFELEQNFAQKDYISVDTTRGPVNAKLVKLRDIDD